MSLRKKIAAAIILFAAAVFMWGSHTRNSYYKQLAERFPQYDPQVIRKAYDEMMKDSFLGNLPNIHNYDDYQMDELFHSYVYDTLNP